LQLNWCFIIGCVTGSITSSVIVSRWFWSPKHIRKLRIKQWEKDIKKAQKAGDLELEKILRTKMDEYLNEHN